MPSDVLGALAQVAKQHGGLSSEQADELLRTMQAHKRLQLETW